MRNNKTIKAPEALLQMLKRYSPKSLRDYKNALRDITESCV